MEIGGKVSKSDFEGIISPDFPFTVILKILMILMILKMKNDEALSVK